MEKTLKIKNDDYVIYKGLECRVTNQSEKWRILSENSLSLSLGFEQLPYNDIELYVKLISITNIESYYSLRTEAVYEGNEYDFYPEDDEKLLLLTYDESIVKKYGLAKVFGRNEFGFFAPLKDITFKEIKRKKKINGVQWWSDDEPIETYITYKL